MTIRPMRSLVLLLLAAVIVGCSSASSSSPIEDDDHPLRDDEELPPDDDRIEEGVTSARWLEITTPAAGESVRAVVELEDGTWESVNVVSSMEGEEGEAAAVTTAAASSPSPPSACKDGAFSRMGYKWKKPFEWRFRSGTTPATNAKSRVEQSLEEAAANVARSRNDCGLARAATPGQVYRGRTRRKANIASSTTSVRCGARDGFNVVSFGVLPKGVVGLACTWSIGDEAIESDVKLNDHGYRWFAKSSVPSDCRTSAGGSFSVEGVATHEFGHAFGLGHVSESGHGNLTMSTQTRACTVRDASLGRGDVLGLRKVYGP